MKIILLLRRRQNKHADGQPLIICSDQPDIKLNYHRTLAVARVMDMGDTVTGMGNLLKDTVGALLIGVCFAMFFQGVLTVQSYVYYMQFPSDPLRTRLLVGVLWLFDFAHLILISDALYSYAVINWGNVEALQFSTPILDAHLIPLSLATIVCQGFFLHRIWLFSKGNILVIPLALACLATFGLAITGAIQASSDLSASAFQEIINRNVIIALFSLGAASTFCIYLALVFT
ncbi:hypothetical protein BDN72DRAFT_503531 [Pluteus cervinus]|uniref:Uncharacterized protein n=1 Tax=Pluteus cervinus TaxID=181527 RepID=A0ACD3AZ61_9AGAR|nr:hypothetical protein BDN72DRAFT_503531 [Pluteus cervinus]